VRGQETHLFQTGLDPCTFCLGADM
jgi:hypothetical protein